MDSSISPVDVSTSFSCDPKDLVFDIKELAVVAVTGVGYSVNAEGKDFQVVVVDGSGRRNSVTVGHKRISITNKLVIG